MSHTDLMPGQRGCLRTPASLLVARLIDDMLVACRVAGSARIQ